MKLLVIASTYPRWPGDHEPGFVHELAKRLTEGFTVTVLCPHSPGAARKEVMDGVEVVRYRYAPEKLQLLVNDGGIVNNLIARPWLWCVLPFFFLCQLRALIKLNRRLNPDVIHAHWIIPQGLTVAFAKSMGVRLAPCLLTSHGGDLFALRGRLFKRLKLYAISKSSALTVVSSVMQKRAVEIGVPPAKVRVRSMGVDLQNRFVPLSRSGLPGSSSILFVGRLVAKKGADILIRAIPRVREAFPHIQVDIVGFGPEERKLRKLTEVLELSETIHFQGARNQGDVVGFYQRASVLAAPFVRASSGDEDGLGLVIAEALASGCPVVTTDLPATRDIVQGLEGVATAVSGCSDALAESLITVLRNEALWRERVLKERPTVMAKLDWLNVAADYRAILKSVAKHEQTG